MFNRYKSLFNKNSCIYSTSESSLSNNYIHETMKLPSSKQHFLDLQSRMASQVPLITVHVRIIAFFAVYFGEAIERGGKGVRNSPALEYACTQIASTTG